MARKTFVLDTNVLLHSADALNSFEDNEIVIPIVVLDEIDKFKKGSSEINRNARLFIKKLDELRLQGSLTDGIELPNGGLLKVVIDLGKTAMSKLLPDGFENSNDNRILAHVLELKKHNKTRKTILVSKDINMRVKADAMGITAEDYEADKVEINELYTGQTEIYITPEEMSDFYKTGKMTNHIEDLKPNEYVTMINSNNPNGTALGRYDSIMREIVPLKIEDSIFGITPRNREQRFAADMLLNDKIKLVTIMGKAGTGKTLLALAAGLSKVIGSSDIYDGDDEVTRFRKLNVYRPIIPMGKDIGYLPGREEDKIHPYMYPIYDNLEYLLHDDSFRKDDEKFSGTNITAKYLQDAEKLEVKALTYIRGRSLPYQIILVDEAQNLTPHEAKTIITRAGEGTKIILTGDINQIDNPYIDSTSNGLAYIVERFKYQNLAAHVTLTKGERSDLAELAATLLD